MGPHYATILLLLVAAFPLGMSGQDGNCAAAMQMFRERQWSDASAAFEECEKHNPRKTDALLYRGKALVNLRQFDEAATALQLYANLHPQSDDALYLLAFIFFRQDKPQESLRLFSEAGKLKPPSANDLTIVALDYVLLTDYDDAAHYLELALQMDPDDIEARYHLGRVRYQQNQFDLAIEAFQKVLQRDPASVKAEDNLGLSYEAKNQTEAAITAYRRAIELDRATPSHTEQPYLNLGSMLAKSSRFEEAIPLLTRAAEISPNEFKVHYELGKVYFDCSQFADARQQAEQAVRLSGDNSSGHYLLGRIYQRLKEKELATEQFQLTAKLIRENGANSRGMASGAVSH